MKNLDTNQFVSKVTSEIEASLGNEYPLNDNEKKQIIGWEPKSIKEINVLGVPAPPKDYTYVVGAEALEWPIKKCDNHHIYLVPKINLITELDGECYGAKLKLWHKTKNVRIWLAGFASLDEENYVELGPTIKNSEVQDNKNEVIIGGEPLQEDFSGEQHILASISTAYSRYTNSCDCGDRYADNCAHFISNALIKAGYSLGSGAKCRCGRLIRAKELLNWVRSRPGRQFSSNHNSIRSGIWIVYQERSDGQGHILFHKELPDKYYWKGTGDYDNWAVQWHYSF